MRDYQLADVVIPEGLYGDVAGASAALQLAAALTEAPASLPALIATALVAVAFLSFTEATLHLSRLALTLELLLGFGSVALAAAGWRTQRAWLVVLSAVPLAAACQGRPPAAGYLTILHVAAQCVTDLNTILSPFLPFSANAVDTVLGGDGTVQPLPQIAEVDDLDGGPGYPVVTGDYTATRAWAHRPIEPGTPVAAPTPVFIKLDPKIIEEEVARLG